MAVPAAKVKSVCTPSETALVRASRKGQIEDLTPAELKRNSARARKLFDKWQGLSRGQSRTRSRATGFGERDDNTKLKAQIFREALNNFEARLAKADARASSASKSGARKTKKTRSASHRAARADVREQLSEAEIALNAKKRPTKKKPAKKKPAATKSPATKPAAEAVSVFPPLESQADEAGASAAPTKKRPRIKTASPGKSPLAAMGIDNSKQRKAVTLAKQSRIVRGGTTTRLRGHVSAQGKRTQARRDSRR